MSGLINIPQGPFLDPSSATGVSQSWIQYLRDLGGSGDGSIPSGPPGAVLGYTTGGAPAASLTLTANQLVVGTGNAPPESLGTSGTTHTVLHGNATSLPGFGPVNLTTDVTGVLPTANGGTGGASGVKIVVIGDSLSAQNFLLHDAWPAVFQRTMNAADAPCTVVNLAIDGCTCYRAWQPPGYSGPTNYVFGTNTPVQEAIAQAPQLVLVMLGFNDAITAVDSRTLAQIEADALGLFAALRAGLPTAKIVYVSELPYDNVNFTVTASSCNAQSMGVVPYLFQPNTTGILTNAYCVEALTNVVNSAKQTLLETWFSFDAYVKALNSAAGVDAYFTMWYWRVARLGCLGPDMLHPTEAGCLLENGYIMKGIVNLPFVSTLFPKIVNQNYGVWNDPDTYFTQFLFTTGSGYYYSSDGGPCDEYITQNGSRQQIHPYDDSWFLPYHTRFAINPYLGLGGIPETFSITVTDDSASIYSWTVERGPPFAGIAVSIDGGAFNFVGNLVGFEGFAQGIGTGHGTGLTVGTHTIRYKATTGGGAVEIYGPYTFIVSATSNAIKGTTLISTVATGTAPLTVASETVVNNLNAQFCNGFSFTGGASGPATGTSVLTGKPGSNSNSAWASLTTTAGAVFYFQAWT
jgi:hypothetical protein